MKAFLWFLCEFCFLSSATVINSAIYQDGSRVDMSVVNSPIIKSMDPQFNIDASFEGPKLPLISVLVNIVELLVDQGLQTFSGSTRLRSWELKKYPRVQIIISPDIAGEAIERRFVIWGLSQVAGLMINSRRFQTATLTLKWKGERVGRILVTAGSTSLHIIQAASAKSTQLLSGDVNTTIAESAATFPGFPKNANTTVDAKDRRFSVQATLEGSILDLFDVFRLVIVMLVNAAENGASQRITGYVSPTSLAGVEITISTPDPASTAPPFFETQWLLKLMATIPECMIKQGVFQEAEIVVRVDGVTVANAIVRKKLSIVGSPSNSSNTLVS